MRWQVGEGAGRDYSTGTRARMEISCGATMARLGSPISISPRVLAVGVCRRRQDWERRVVQSRSSCILIFSRIKKGTSTKWSAFGFTVVIFCIRYMALLCPYKLRIHFLSTRSIFRCSCLLLYVPGVSRCI